MICLKMERRRKAIETITRAISKNPNEVFFPENFMDSGKEIIRWESTCNKINPFCFFELSKQDALYRKECFEMVQSPYRTWLLGGDCDCLATLVFCLTYHSKVLLIGNNTLSHAINLISHRQKYIVIDLAALTIKPEIWYYFKDKYFDSLKDVKNEIFDKYSINRMTVLVSHTRERQ